MKIIEQEIQETMAIFKAAGWHVQRLTGEDVEQGRMPLFPTKAGGGVRCSDERYIWELLLPEGISTPEELNGQLKLGPAVFGSVEGVAAMTPQRNIVKKFHIGTKMIDRSGFTPESHGDMLHGLFLGCGFISAWLKGMIPGLEPVTLAQIETATRVHGINRLVLPGSHRARKMVLNFQPDTTFFQDGEILSNDIWFLRRLGFKLHEAVGMALSVGEIVLPTENRNLLVY